MCGNIAKFFGPKTIRCGNNCNGCESINCPNINSNNNNDTIINVESLKKSSKLEIDDDENDTKPPAARQ